MSISSIHNEDGVVMPAVNAIAVTVSQYETVGTTSEALTPVPEGATSLAIDNLGDYPVFIRFSSSNASAGDNGFDLCVPALCSKSMPIVRKVNSRATTGELPVQAITTGGDTTIAVVYYII